MSEVFIALTYGNSGFLLPRQDVQSAVSVTRKDCVTLEDKKYVSTAFGQFSFFDLDDLMVQSGITVKDTSVKTALLFKDKALVTSAACSVEKHAWGEFSLFSDYYGQAFEKRGLIACRFSKDAVQYLVDVEKLGGFIKW